MTAGIRWYKLMYQARRENMRTRFMTSCPYVREMLTAYSKPTILEVQPQGGGNSEWRPHSFVRF